MRVGILLSAAAAVAALVAAGPASAEGKAEEGKKVFNQCKACHSVEAGKNGVGPSLKGVIGRKSGTVDGFKYSDQMKNANIVWNDDALAKYLKNPKEFIPGNKMVFVGLKKESQIEDVIAYLKDAAK